MTGESPLLSCHALDPKAIWNRFWRMNMNLHLGQEEFLSRPEKGKPEHRAEEKHMAQRSQAPCWSHTASGRTGTWLLLTGSSVRLRAPHSSCPHDCLTARRCFSDSRYPLFVFTPMFYSFLICCLWFDRDWEELVGTTVFCTKPKGSEPAAHALMVLCLGLAGYSYFSDGLSFSFLSWFITVLFLDCWL